MTCPDEETVLAFVRGRLSGAAFSLVEEHLGACADCRAIVAEASRLLPPKDAATGSDHGPEAGAPDLPAVRRPHRLLLAGSAVSRYLIEAPLGAGSAGIVYRAYDPQLLRHVALKLLPPDAAPGDAQARWLREAQVMAQLSHPNVVAVYDVGLHDGSVFIAMAIAQGSTISEWLRARKRTWQDILGVFLEAGRGLAAAHAAGIVHRDFKPDNVLVTEDGRTCVVDFGLARPLGEDAGDAGRTGVPGVAQPGHLAMNLTSAGALVGTPAYMAPEQFSGREMDARSDQFSFCVALHFAIYGSWPYGLGRARDAVEDDLRPPPEGHAVPPRLFDVLRRGLKPDSGQRYAGMDDLIAALRGAAAGGAIPVPRRKPAHAMSAGLVLAIAGAVIWLAAGGAPARECGDGKLRAGVEECDDGNLVDGDGCSARCLACRTGDRSFLWTGNGHCYSVHTAPATWDDARLACARAGGADLATLDTGHERTAAATSLLSDVTVPTWIGFQRTGGTLKMVTGEMPDGRYSWVPGEPSDRDGCVFQQPLSEGKAAFVGGVVTLMTIGDCSRPMSYVCERAPWLIRPRGTHAYRLITQPAPWARARDACRSLGGHLATAADDDEHVFIANAARGDAWIGASDVAVAGRFEWITGEPFRYRSFAGGEPDNGGQRPPNCLVTDAGGRWHDRKCDDAFPSLCEID